MTDYPRAAAQLLVDVSVRALLLAALAAIVLRFWSPRNANFQHRAWTVVLWGMLLLPVLQQLTPALALLPDSLAWRSRQPHPVTVPLGGPSSSAGEKIVGQHTEFQIAADPAEPTPEQPADTSRPVVDSGRQAADGDRPAASAAVNSAAVTSAAVMSARRWPGVVLAVYFCGVALLLARLAIGYWGAHRLVRRATSIPRPLGCRARLATSDAVRVPVTVGLLRPVILLPPDKDCWSDALLSSVVMHEQAHVDRRDHLVLLLSEVNRSLYWFHPVAWFLRRRLSALAEQCCDDTVIGALGNRSDYAQHLLEIAERLAIAPDRVAPLGISMARTSNVESRIVAILDEHRPLARRIGRRGALALLAVVGPIVLFAAGLRGADPQPERRSAAAVAAEPPKTGTEKGAATQPEAETKEVPAAAQAAASAEVLLRGHVVRESDGAAVAGAEVRLMTMKVDRTGFTTRTTKTDAEGNFSFDNVPNGSHRVLASLDDLVSRAERYQATKIEFDANHPLDEPVVLKLSPAPSIGVHVTSKASGAPVADARVRLVWTDTERDHPTDSEGNVLLRGLTPEIWTVEVQAKGFAEQVIPIKLFGNQRADLNFALEPGGVLHGVVHDESGRPLTAVGISIRAATNMSEQIEYMKSDSDGRYHFDFLPLDRQLEVQSSGPQYVNNRQKTIVPSEGSRDVELDVTMERRPDGGSVEGVVTDTAGKPIVGARLTNQGNSSNQVHETTTDAAGRFIVDNLYASTFGYQVVVRAEGFAPQAISVEPGPEDSPTKVAVKLEPGHRIRGQVLNAAGKPIAGARVFYANGDGFGADNIGGNTTTDSAGRFAFDSLPADSPFDFRAAGYSPVNEKVLPLDGAEEVTITLQSQGIVRGRVVDAKTGKPITAFTVRITFSPDREPDDPRSGLSGRAVFGGERFESTDGAFRLEDLMVGLPVQVTVDANHFGPTTQRRIVARPEPEAETVEFKLTPLDPATLATLKGTIKNEEGKPIAGAELRLIAADNRPAQRDQFPFNWEMIVSGQIGQVDGVVQFLSTTSNQRGDFHFDQVRTDRDLELVYWGEGVSEGRVEHVEKIPAAERNPLHVVVVTPGGLQGKINREALPQVSGVAASRRGGRSFTEYFYEQSDKSYQLRNLPPGEYDFAVYGEKVRSAPGAESYSFKVIQRQTVRIESGKTVTIDVGFDTPPGKDPQKRVGAKGPALEKPKATASVATLPSKTPAASEPSADNQSGPPPHSLAGRVVDDAGNPISEALVSLRFGWSSGPEHQPLAASTRTDAAGHFVLEFKPEWLLPTNSVTQTIVWAHAPGHSLGVQSAQKQLVQREPGEIEIVLGPATDTAFRVVDPQGSPVVGTPVEPWHLLAPHNAYDIPPDDIRRAASGTTDADGIARLPALNRKGLRAVQVVAPKFGEQRAALDDTAEAPAQRTIHLRPVGRLELHVTADTPEHVGKLRVAATTSITKALQSDRPDEARQTEGEVAGVTDNQGLFVASELPAGEVRFSVNVDPALPLRARLPETQQIVAGQTNRIEIALEPAVRVRGLVRTKADSKPVAGTLIGIHYGSGKTRQSDYVRTDVEGRFEAYARPGLVWQQVITLPKSLVQVGASNQQLQVPAGKEIFDLPPIEMVETKEIAGQVINQFDEPVVGVVVNGMTGHRTYGHATTTDDGHFTMRVPPDMEIRYQARPEGQGSIDADIVKDDPLVLRIRVVKESPAKQP